MSQAAGCPVTSHFIMFYTLRGSDLRYTIFGHVGDNHVHVNILPRNDAEAAKAREIYLRFVKRAQWCGRTGSNWDR